MLDCGPLEWSNRPHQPWDRSETEDGQVVLRVSIRKNDFKCFDENITIIELELQISFEERTRKNNQKDSCYVRDAAKTKSNVSNIIKATHPSQSNILTHKTTPPSIALTFREKPRTSTTVETTTTTTTTTTKSTTTTTSTTPKMLIKEMTQEIKLERWRGYRLKVTVTDPKYKVSISKVFKYDTYQWQCDNTGGIVISQEQFCNNEPDCPITSKYPRGRDEDPSVCRVSELPKNLGYLIYLIMIGVLAIYFSRRKLETNSLSTLIQTTAMNVNVVIPNTLEILKWRGTTETFIEEYITLHNSNQIVSFCQHIKLWYYNHMDVERQQRVFTNIRKAEERIHGNAKDRYQCILKNYGGDAAVTERICCPDGTIVDIIKNSLQKVYNLICGFTYDTNSSAFPWHVVDTSFGFILLCSHLFDYIKDIGKYLLVIPFSIH